MGREQDGHVMLGGDPPQQVDDFVLAGDVEVRQRLVEEEKLRLADQGLGDQYPLLLSAREAAHPGVSEAHGADRLEHLVDPLAAACRRCGQTEAVPVQPEPHDVAGPQGKVGVDKDLLGHVADRPVAAGPRCAIDEDLAVGRLQQPQDHPQNGGLTGAVGPDQSGELARPDGEVDVMEDLPTRKPYADPIEGHHVGKCRFRAHRDSASVEVPWARALYRALTSACIQDW